MNKNDTDETIRPTRRSDVMKGIQQGMVKAAVDQLVDTMAGPVTEAIMKNMSADHPSIEILEPAVKAAIRFCFIMGAAELMDFAAPMAGKYVPKLSEDKAIRKSRLLSQWMRKYAGERVGEQVVQAAIQVFPLVMSYFSEFDTEQLELILEDDEPNFMASAPAEEPEKVNLAFLLDAPK